MYLKGTQTALSTQFSSGHLKENGGGEGSKSLGDRQWRIKGTKMKLGHTPEASRWQGCRTIVTDLYAAGVTGSKQVSTLMAFIYRYTLYRSFYSLYLYHYTNTCIWFQPKFVFVLKSKFCFWMKWLATIIPGTKTRVLSFKCRFIYMYHILNNIIS